RPAQPETRVQQPEDADAGQGVAETDEQRKKLGVVQRQPASQLRRDQKDRREVRRKETLAAENMGGRQRRTAMGGEVGQQAGIQEETAPDVEMIEDEAGEGGERHDEGGRGA